MIRSGSTVQYQITKDILESTGKGCGLGWIEPDDFPDLAAKYQHDDRYLAVKTHAFIAGADDMVAAGQAKAIYVFRDIRDVVVSLMHKRKKSFWFIVLATRYIDVAVENHNNWKSVENILISKYDEMSGNLKGEALRIAGYLGIELKDAEAERIADKYAIEKQVNRIKQLEARSERLGNIIDSDMLLHYNHIRSGRVGQWQDTLTGFQIRIIEALSPDVFLNKSDKLINPLIAAIVKSINRVIVLAKIKFISAKEIHKG